MIKSIEKIYSDIESVRGSSDRVTAGLKYNYYSYLNIVDVKRLQLEKQLTALKHSRASSYEDTVKGVERKVQELKLLLYKINGLFVS